MEARAQKNAKIWPLTKVVVGRNDVPQKFRAPYSQDHRLAALVQNLNGTEDATVQQLQNLFIHPLK
jgi:hypothetical protein